MARAGPALALALGLALQLSLVAAAPQPQPSQPHQEANQEPDKLPLMLLVANERQIKLYPARPEPGPGQQLRVAQHFYLLRSGAPQAPPRPSVVPQLEATEEAAALGRISHLDYLFDDRFCQPPASGAAPDTQGQHQQQQQQQQHCLLVLWLHHNNSQLRYGALDLRLQAPSLQPPPAGRPQQRRLQLSLQQLSPIELADPRRPAPQLRPRALLVDRRTSSVHVALAPANQSQPDTLVSLRLPGPSQAHPDLFRRTQINQCAAHAPAASPAASHSLALDPDKPSLLYYVDQRDSGARIFAIDLHHPAQPNQALVRDISMVAQAWPQRVKRDSCMALDPNQRRFFWLNPLNELHSCDITGAGARLEASLAARPQVLAPQAMQVYRNSLLFTDSARKSLLQLPLDSDPAGQHPPRLQQVALLVDMFDINSFQLVDSSRVRPPTSSPDQPPAPRPQLSYSFDHCADPEPHSPEPVPDDTDVDQVLKLVLKVALLQGFLSVAILAVYLLIRRWRLAADTQSARLFDDPDSSSVRKLKCPV